MGQWIKTLATGVKIVGEDSATTAKLVSWSRTPNDDLLQVSLEHQGFTLEIVGLGTYWQSDTYEAAYPGPQSVLIQRRIEKKIEATNQVFRIIQQPKLLRAVFDNMIVGKAVPIQKAWVGQWLILEYDLRTASARYYVRGKKF